MYSPFISSGWDDYQLIDTGDGKRLERLAGFELIRPEPTALWSKSMPEHPGWSSPAALFEQNTGWEMKKKLPESIELKWNNLKIRSRLTKFKHLGFFPEQINQWGWLENIITSKRGASRIRVLNLFAYTGVASVVAAKSGAEVCHVDSAKGSVRWASENALENGLSEAPIRWIVDDVRKFVQREVRRGAKYDIILLDPPVFGRGAKGEVWRLADDLPGLLKDIASLWSEEPLGFLMNFYATDLYPHAIERLCNDRFAQTLSGGCAHHVVGITQGEGPQCLQTGDLICWQRE